MRKYDIKDFTLKELEKAFVNINEPKYRSKQVLDWLYHKGATSFNEMNNLSLKLRTKLEKNYYVSNLKPVQHLRAQDLTEKFLFELSDGNFIETVVICTKNRMTVCLSTQVGCKFGCLFCASGRNGFLRNLTSAEIINQILFLTQGLKHKITNYVFMGMGEPLDNYQNVSKAILMMNSEQGLNIGARRITVSTCGIIPGIRKLQEMGLQINLSVSLHAATDKLRNILVPANNRYPIAELIEACGNFMETTGRGITLEYVLIKDKNDSLKESYALESIARKLKAKVNVIPYSPVPGLDLIAPQRQDIERFMNRLLRAKIQVTLRESKGKDIQAACGQLAGRFQSRKKT